jgi:DivIVA domain-containing protein
MQETHDIRNRTFSFGAHGYNQDDVDRYLRELADRVESTDVDWHAELRRLEDQSFAVVSLGYWRPDVDTYMAELKAWMGERAGASPMNGSAAVEDESTPATEAAAEPAATESGWAQGIVERLRRVTEASTAPTALADVVEPPVPDVVAAAPAAVAEDTAADEQTVATEADRVRLFRMAVALGVEDAVSMTADELVAAIDRVQAGGELEADDPIAAGPAEDPTVALARTKATLASFERMLADQVSQVTAATRLEQESAARRAESILRDAERRAGEILAAAERDGDAVEERAHRYSERVRRMADREALRRAAAVEAQPQPEMAAEPEPEPAEEAEPEPEMAAQPEPVVEPEPEPAAVVEEEAEAAPEPEPAVEEEPETAADDEPELEVEETGSEPAPVPQPAKAASRWDRMRRMIGG